MAENASECDASTMQTDGATADPTSDEMVPKMEVDIKIAEEALPLLPKNEDEVTKPKKPKYNLMECSIILEPLTEEMILKYTTAPFPPSRHSLRPVSPSEKSRFNRFKKHRDKFVKKRGRKRKHSEEDSFSDALSPEQVEENNKKKKKLGYEQDVDWSPPEDCNPAPARQTKKSNLRLNPRRKRIESGSSEESEEGQKVCETGRRCSDPSKRAFLGESSEDESFFNFFAEEEVSITKEESDPPIDDPVVQLVTDMIDTVATIVESPESTPKCRWCDTEISDPLSILCPICKDMGYGETIKPKKQRAKKQKNASNQASAKKGKKKSGNNIVSKLRKMLPKQEMQQILFNNSNKKVGEGKKFNHLRTKKTPKRQEMVKSLSTESFEDQLLKASQVTKANQANQKAAKILKKASANVDQKSLVAVNKNQGMKTVLEPEIPKTAASQPTNVQHGTYLLPTVPSVVVANYATSDAEKGDYFLSSLYYKNESTPSKAAVSNAASNALVTLSNNVNAMRTGMPNKTVTVNMLSAASKRTVPSLTVREIVHNQLQVTPVSKTTLNPQMNSAPRAPFLSNSSISLVPIAPKPSSSSNSTNQRVQITPVSNNLSMPSLSALVDSTPSASPSSSSMSSPARSQTQLSAALSAMNPHLQISTFPAVMPPSSPSVMQPLASIPASNVFGMSQNLQLIPVSKPSVSVITKTEPRNSLEEIMQEINPSLLITPISNAPSLAQTSNVTQNAPLMGTELPFSSDGSLSENLLSSLPFNSDVSLIPAQIEELTSATFTGLLDNQNETSPEKEGQFGDQSVDDVLSIQTAVQITPMDTSLQTSENTQSADDSLENQSCLKDSSSKKKAFSPPDITQSIIASLKESMTLREKTLRELDAICIMCITDFDEDPKSSLLRFIESNRQKQEELLLKQKSVNNSEEGEKDKAPEEQANLIEKQLQALERNANVYDIAWQYLKYHSSFQKYSDTLLRTSRFLNVQIKKELIEQGEEEGTSSCQFASQKATSNFQVAGNPSQQLSSNQTAAINNILCQMQSQVNNIPNATSYPGMVASNMNMQYHGLAPVSASMGGDPSRETPSRGSGPRTPARPESALSQPEEILPLAPIQNAMPMQTATYSQNTGQPVNVQRINIGPLQAVRSAGTLPSGGQLMFHNSNPQTYQRMLVSMGQRQATPTFQTQVRSSNGKVYNVTRVDVPRMIRPSYAVQTNYVPTTAAVSGPNHQNSYATMSATPNQNNYGGSVAVPVSLQNNYGSSVVPVPLQNNYGTTTVPVSLQNLTPGTTVVLQAGQSLQNQNRQPTESVDVSSLRCAVCYGVATLRCKQCSKVAYCNTTCAKKYWHSRHKMECLQLMNT